MQKIQTGLRIPEDRYKELSEIAERSGASINSVVLLLVELGLEAVNLGAEEAVRSLLRKRQGTS